MRHSIHLRSCGRKGVRRGVEVVGMETPAATEAPEVIDYFDRDVPEGDVCPSQTAIGMIADKWKLLILIQLARSGMLRFKELQRAIGTISQKMLTSSLRELEADGLVERTVYAEVPPRVEYRATARARELLPILRQLEDWAVRTNPKAAILADPKPVAS
jgi:DNA-binding HxlR family transcriptional regulator